MKITIRDQLPKTGFAGIREHRLVTDSRTFGHYKPTYGQEGLGQFVYLADAQFVPHGETRMHSHREIDVISLMARGRVRHEGSLGHGTELPEGSIQVQRAGGEGFSHNEVNPDSVPNRMIQMWVLPEKAGEDAGYKTYQPKTFGSLRIYGGTDKQTETFPGQTLIDILDLQQDELFTMPEESLLYVVDGTLETEGTLLGEGTLLRGQSVSFTATSNARLIWVHLMSEVTR